MINLSIMTMSVVGEYYHLYKQTGDKEHFKSNYEKMLDCVKRAGYFSVDVTAYEIILFGEEYIKNQLSKRGLKVSCYIYFDKFVLEDSGMNERINKAKEAVDLASRLGTNIFMLVPESHDGIVLLNPKQIRKNVISHWIPVANYAINKGLCPAIEDAPDLKLYLCKVEDVKEVLDAVAGLKLVYDSANMLFEGENPVEYIKEFRNKISYVHLKDVKQAELQNESVDITRNGMPLKTVPTGTGEVDLKEIIRTLQEIGYKGCMTVEFVKHHNKTLLESMIECRQYVEKCLQ